MHRKRRPIEPEAVFGQIKSNKGYNRFRHFDEEKPEKVMMDFAIFAIAFNVLKLHKKMKYTGENPPNLQKNAVFLRFFVVFTISISNFEKVEKIDREKFQFAA